MLGVFEINLIFILIIIFIYILNERKNFVMEYCYKIIVLNNKKF